MKIYHNPNCSKSRCALNILEKYQLKFEVVNYLEVGVEAAEVINISRVLKIKVHELVREKEEQYKAFDIDWNDNIQAARAIEKSPILLERPIIIDGDRGIIARPVELLNDFLKG